MPVSSPIKRHGGKSYLAKQIRALMPPHTRYAEPYFGSGAVLFSGDGEGVAEFVNDIDWKLAKFWQVLADPEKFNLFYRLVLCIPLSQAEFEASKLAHQYADDIRNAAGFFVNNRQSRQGLGRDYCTPTSRLRRGMNEQVSAWLSAVDGLPEFHARLRRVEIRCQDALGFIRELDSPETFFYCDPPYLHETRSSTGEYEHEMNYEQHETLLHFLHRIQGKFILSGYHSDLYDRFAAVAGWKVVEIEIDNKASSSKTKQRKTECLWRNYQ